MLTYTCDTSRHPRKTCLLQAQTLGLQRAQGRGSPRGPAGQVPWGGRTPGVRSEGWAKCLPRVREPSPHRAHATPAWPLSSPPLPFFPLSSPPSPRHPLAARAHSLGVLQRWTPVTPAPASTEAGARTAAGPTCVSAQRASSATTARQVGAEPGCPSPATPGWLGSLQSQGPRNHHSPHLG